MQTAGGQPLHSTQQYGSREHCPLKHATVFCMLCWGEPGLRHELCVNMEGLSEQYSAAQYAAWLLRDSVHREPGMVSVLPWLVQRFSLHRALMLER